MSDHWTVERDTIRQIMEGKRPGVVSLKLRVDEINKNPFGSPNVKLSLAFCDKDHNAVVTLDLPILQELSIVTLDHFERSLDIHITGNRCPKCDGHGRLVQGEPWKAPIECCSTCNGSGVV